VQRTKDPPPPAASTFHHNHKQNNQPFSAALLSSLFQLKLYSSTSQPWPTKMKLPPLSLTMGLECAKVGIVNYTYLICNHVVVVGGGNCRRRGASATVCRINTAAT
jgi:hypothetical protein